MILKFNSPLFADWIILTFNLSNLFSELFTSERNSLKIAFIETDNVSFEGNILCSFQVISRNHSDIDLVVISQLNVIVVVSKSDHLNRLVNVFADGVLQPKGNKIYEFGLKFFSEVFGLLRMKL